MGVGKSAIIYTAIATLHRRDPFALAAYIDTEGTIDWHWVKGFGIDLSRFVYITNPSGQENEVMNTEDALNTLEMLVDMRKFAIIGFDSVANMAASAEMAGEIGTNTIARNATRLPRKTPPTWFAMRTPARSSRPKSHRQPSCLPTRCGRKSG